MIIVSKRRVIERVNTTCLTGYLALLPFAIIINLVFHQLHPHVSTMFINNYTLSPVFPHADFNIHPYCASQMNSAFANILQQWLQIKRRWENWINKACAAYYDYSLYYRNFMIAIISHSNYIAFKEFNACILCDIGLYKYVKFVYLYLIEYAVKIFISYIFCSNINFNISVVILKL